MTSLWEQVKEIEDRLEMTIAFTLVQFFYDFFVSVIDETGMFYVCYVVFVLATGACMVHSGKVVQSAQAIVWSMMQNFSMMIFNQNLTRVVTGYVDASSEMYWSVSAMRLAAGISIVTVAIVLPEAILQSTFMQQSVSLLLHMLTDASSNMLT